jgi:hypothetical protein
MQSKKPPQADIIGCVLIDAWLKIVEQKSRRGDWEDDTIENAYTVPLLTGKQSFF